jgi:hypothetical protein
MTVLRRAFLLVSTFLLALSGCQSEPMPQGEIPQDFLFSYRYEPLGEGDSPPPPELPEFWRITLDVGGLVDYEVKFGNPQPVVKRDSFQITEEQLDRIYHAVRDARLHEMPRTFTGDEREAGKESFYVVSRNQPMEVTAEATKVPELARLRDLLYEELGILKLLERPVRTERKVVLDWRTGIFYPADSPPVSEIPPQHRREYSNPWDALNAGGVPSQDYDPFEGFE